MQLGNNNLHIMKTRQGTYWAEGVAYGIQWAEVQDPIIVSALADLYRRVVRHELTDSQMDTLFKQAFGITDGGSSQGQIPVINTKALAQKLMDFFSEFHFEPNFRFMNTLAFYYNKNDIKSYVTNYFTLIDSPFTSSVVEKMKSSEFNDIINDLLSVTPKTRINKRFELYYGSQGTGKTTKAMQYASSCMVCHSAMLPQDLMEDFSFTDGKAGFTPSVLYKAMVEGKTIVLDEINLLPFESLRFLQSILDGKEEITYKGQIIKIADGFKIIGTMNLVVNGAVFSLPEPLIDRASDLKEFKLTATDLMAAFA